MHLYVKNKIISFRDYNAKCAVGKRGISIKKREGDLRTPKGSFALEYVLYRKDRTKNIQTSIKKKIIKKNMGWCNDPKSKQYNKLIYFPFKFSAEKLYRKDHCYDIIIVISYNRLNILKNKGSAIFLHLAKKNFTSTEGCVAVNKKTMLKLLRFINTRSRILIR